jgi:GH18 family chitinase
MLGVFALLVLVGVGIWLLVLYRPKKSKPLTCASTEDCVAGTYCSRPDGPGAKDAEGTCVPGCDTDAACGALQGCKNNLCQGLVCMSNSDCTSPQTCENTINATKKMCRGPPVVQPVAVGARCSLSSKQIGLGVRNTVRVLRSIGVPPGKVVVGVTLTGTSVFPAEGDALYTPVDTTALSPGPVFTAGEILDGTVAQLGRLDFKPRDASSTLLRTNGDANPASWYNTWAYVPFGEALARTPWADLTLAATPTAFDDVPATGGLFLSFESVNSIQKKAEFVTSSGLGGMYVENIEGDSARNSLSASLAGVRRVGYLTGNPGDAAVFATARNYTHVNLGPFTISYQRGGAGGAGASFYVDTTNAVVDFATSGADVACGAWPANSASDATANNTCLAPALGARPLDACVAPVPNTLVPPGSDEWQCWNDQPGRTCHTGGGVLGDTCAKTAARPETTEVRCVAASAWCGRVAAKAKLQALDPPVKVLLSLGGANDSAYFSVACSDTYRPAFVLSICAWVQTFGFDGVDVNWKYPLLEKCNGGALPPGVERPRSLVPSCPAASFTDCSVCGPVCLYGARADDARKMLALLRDLRVAINGLTLAPGVARPLLTATISVQPTHLQKMNYGAMSSYVDYFNVECFNFNDATTGVNPVTDIASPLDVFCTSKGTEAHCNSVTLGERCDAETGVCVECNSDGDCARAGALRDGTKCDARTHACYCETSKDCRAGALGRPACGGAKKCVACRGDSECTPGLRCDVPSGACVACRSDGDCPVANTCDGATNTCTPTPTAFNAPQFSYHQKIDVTMGPNTPPYSASAPLFFDNWPLESVPLDQYAVLRINNLQQKHDYQKDRQLYWAQGDPRDKSAWDVQTHGSFKTMNYKREKWEGNAERCCAGGPGVAYVGPTRDVTGNEIKDANGNSVNALGTKLDASKCLAGGTSVNYLNDFIGFSGTDPQYWMPWSPVCDTSGVVTQYCASTSTSSGQSNLIADPNCTAWCRDHPDACDAIMVDYCKRNPTASECACQYYAESPFYQSFMTQLQNSTVTAATLGVSLDNPACWVPACTGENLVTVLRPTNMEKAYQTCYEKNPAGRNLNICTQLIGVAGSDNVRIDDLSWSQVCGDYPNPSDQTCSTACSNGNVCLLGSCSCASSSYPCTGSAVCSAAGCLDTCAGDNTKSCTRNNACRADGTCACGDGAPCGEGEFCQLGACVQDCVPPPPLGERCVAGAARCGANPGCADYEVCDNGTCTRTCGTCTNGNLCDRATGLCRCGTSGVCVGTQACKTNASGASVCTCGACGPDEHCEDFPGPPTCVK